MVLVAWGAFAFGSVYPWAYVPLFVGCALVGATAFLQYTGGGKPDTMITVSVILPIAAVGLQLVRLSDRMIRWISPETDLFLRPYAIGYLVSVKGHGLSIEPRATMLALMAAIALGVFLLGLVRGMKQDDPLRIARGVTVLGMVMALVGVVQKATWNGKIYGVWQPMEVGSTPFGPFVNRNHFAGWMLMALPLAVGYLCARVAHGMRQVKPNWRDRVLWLSSPDASEIVLVAFAILVMAFALVLTLSRSGILAFVAATTVSAWFAVRRQSTRSRAILVATYLILVVAIASAWAGIDTLAARFGTSDVSDFDGRVAAWTDAWHIARRFPLTGTGLNTYGVATLFYQTADLSRYYAQAHNDYLQLAAEGGALVCVPAIIALSLMIATIRRRLRQARSNSSDYWIRSGAVVGLFAIAIQELSDFSLQMPGNAILFCIVAAIALRARADEPLVGQDYRGS